MATSDISKQMTVFSRTIRLEFGLWWLFRKSHWDKAFWHWPQKKKYFPWQLLETSNYWSLCHIFPKSEITSPVQSPKLIHSNLVCFEIRLLANVVLACWSPTLRQKKGSKQVREVALSEAIHHNFQTLHRIQPPCDFFFPDGQTAKILWRQTPIYLFIYLIVPLMAAWEIDALLLSWIKSNENAAMIIRH